MTKLDGDGNYLSKGNCYATCWASILEIPLSEVPAFEESPPDGSWFFMTIDWLKSLGYQCEISYDKENPPAGWSIGNGPSPRLKGSGHSVVCFDGKIVHDPYRGGNGIERIDYYLFAAPTKPL